MKNDFNDKQNLRSSKDVGVTSTKKKYLSTVCVEMHLVTSHHYMAQYTGLTLSTNPVSINQDE